MAIVKQNFFPFLGLAIVAGAIGMAGVIACGIGIFATIPAMLCIMAVAYRALTGTGPAPAPSVTTAPPETPAAPPTPPAA